MEDEFLLPPAPRPPSSLRHRAEGCGEIVEVQGGHIVRPTGRKDRHSKVCTAKGPRDRRVRLSANTAIQFYDVQDRLGFDRPSKAVDWLIKKAKTSIDKLAQLPPWNPDDAIRQAASNAKPKRPTAKSQISPSPPPPQEQQLQFGGVENPSNIENESSFLTPPMDSDLITDTLKSFFPVVCSSMEAPPSHQLMHNYHQYQHPRDLLSRTNSRNQDLRLSLLHHHTSASASASEPVLFYGQSNPLGFETSNSVNWEQHSSEFGRIQRLLASNSGGADSTSFQRVLGQSQELYSQRSPLQSSYSPMIRAWFDPHHRHQSISTNELNHHHHFAPPVQQGEFFSGFRIPARFQGQEEEQQDKPSSSSSLAIDNPN